MPRLPIAFALSFFAVMTAHSDVSVPSIFSDHMVLQRAAKVPIWGKASPGEAISITLDSQTVKTTAGPDGKWRADLELEKSAQGPFEMTIQGANTIKIADVLVGQVWFAGGQSNMERALANTNGGPEEVAQSANPLLRQFKVERNPQIAPADDCRGTWTVASPESAGKFTAVGYYFGKELQKKLQVPVGLISSSVGGTGSEPWTSGEGLDKDPSLKAVKDRTWPAMKDYLAKKEAFLAAHASWLNDNSREDNKPADLSAFAGEDASTEGWTTVTLPILPAPNAKPPAAGATPPSSTPVAISTAPGVVWLRTDVTLALNNTLEKLPVSFGNIPAFEAIYWNGSLVDELTPQELTGPNANREYNIPPSAMKEGRNVLAIRIFSPASGVTIKNAPKPKVGTVGEWKVKVESELPALEAAALAAQPQAPSQPGSPTGMVGALFNGMVYPVVPYAIKGIVWYQGESNTKRAWQYRTSFPLLIADWRSHWDQGDLPFYFVQLANYMPKEKDAAKSADSIWAETRDAQLLTLKTVPNTAMAVIIDVGEVYDIHPRNKKTVGERLALIALARDYEQSSAYSGPIYESFKVEGNVIRLSFSHTDGGLAAAPVPTTVDEKSLIKKSSPLKRNSPKSQLEGFIICGADKQWVWADARIDGDSVLVSSDQVPAPVAVRYAWSDNPSCNLTNASGLPASPFRTDDFPLTTVGVKY